MPNHPSLAIANEFLARRGKNVFPAQMQIQKLVYIAHGWNLAINNEPLVSKRPEAWDNGPVFRSIWNHVRDYGYGRDRCRFELPGQRAPLQAALTSSERSIIDHVQNKYGRFSGAELSRMTHQSGTPWSKAYFERGQNSELSDSEIRAHYTRLALAGRA